MNNICTHPTIGNRQLPEHELHIILLDNTNVYWSSELSSLSVCIIAINTPGHSKVQTSFLK